MVNLNIGQKIQRYRNQRGLSLRGLAEKTGITASMISQIENNSVNPSINTLKTPVILDDYLAWRKDHPGEI